jgi:CO/xanthine dehydrogenase Mo-binding subunit
MFAAAVAFAEVEVDIQTGRTELVRITAGHDTGRTINPVMVENQIDLGLIMASGWMLSEEYQIDRRNGAVLSAILVDYKVPTFLDIPRRRDVQQVVMENPCAWGPYGAKGFSESAITALPPAIANAIYNAIGTRIHCGSLTARHILNTIEAVGKR